VMAGITGIFLAIGVALFILETYENRTRHPEVEHTSQDQN